VNSVTAADLARHVRQRTGLPLDPAFAHEMLTDWQRAGIAEAHFGRWRLTDRGWAISGWVTDVVFPGEEDA
jgi:hypothetical protein